MEKRERYAHLVAQRKACDACAPVLTNPSQIDGGRYDSGDRIGGYTRWQGNLDSHLVVVAQDFADVESLYGCGGWPDPALRTNRRLVRFLRLAGFEVELPRPGEPEDAVFFTNAVLCIKQGGISSPVPPRCFERCAVRFLRRMVDVVGPRAVATLGLQALNAALHAYGRPPVEKLGPVVEAGTTFEIGDGIQLFPMPHPSRGANALHEGLWRGLGEWLRGRT